MTKARWIVSSVLGCVLLSLSAQASAWRVLAKWECCGKNPRQRVHVVCKNGLGPKFVNVNGKWHFKKKGMPDGVGYAHPSLDAAARSFCKE